MVRSGNRWALAVVVAAVAAGVGVAEAKQGRAVKKAARAWDVALDAAPSDAEAIIAMDVARLRGTAMYAEASRAIDLQGRKSTGDAMAEACGAVSLDAVDSVALVTDKRGGALVVTWRSLGEDELEACARAVQARLTPGAKFAVERQGRIVTYKVGDAEVLQLAWLGPHVMAMAWPSGDRAALERLTGGKGGGLRGAARFKKAQAATNAGAAIWGVYLEESDFGGGYKVGWASGWIDVKKGQLSLSISAGMGDAGSAKTAVGELTALRDQAALQAPAGFEHLIKAVQLKADGEVLTISMSVVEKDLVNAVKMLLAML